MSTSTLSPTKPEALNTLFGLGDQLQFESGPGGFTIARLSSPWGEATVSVYGGHVLSYTPTGQEPVLWVSEEAQYEAGKAIRGGIPVIWPWFGSNKQDPDKPSHGFARNQTWEVFASRLIDNEKPQLRLILQDNAMSYSAWPHSFRIELIVTLDKSLHVDLQIINTGNSPFDFTGALHTYLNVSQIENASIAGLEGCLYIDQLENMAIKSQHKDITFEAETDNIYFNTKSSCHLLDAGYNRKVVVEKRGSGSTVVWNPWIAKAKRMSDFGNEEYKTMLCIETANAGPDSITLNPGGEHVLGTSIHAFSLENL